MIKRGAQSWTSPDPDLRCAIVTVNVPPIQRADLENWLWKNHKIRIRGGEPVVDRSYQKAPIAKLTAADAHRLLVAARVAAAMHEHSHRPGLVFEGVGEIDIHVERDSACIAVGDVAHDSARLDLI